jgi:hypothetical protein
MASKKKHQLAKHCRIFQWIEAQDPELAGAIRDLCLEGALAGGRRGATFLYPKDKAHRAEIVDKAYTDEADEAARLIEALIIPDALLQSADFKGRPVGSRLGVKYTVEGAEGGKVHLAGGVELVPADGFNPRGAFGSRLAVWVITRGRPPLEGEHYRPPPPEQRGSVPRHGGGLTGGAGAGLNERQIIAANTEAEFDRCMKRDHCRTHNPYLARVVSLLNYLKAKAGGTLQKVLPVLDYEPAVSFYLLFEPYKTRGEYLIPTPLLFGDGAWNGADAYGNAVEEYEAIFRGLPAVAATAPDPQSGAPAVAYVFRDRAAVAARVDAERQRIGGLNPRQAPQAVQESYATLCQHNTISGLGPVLPEATLKALGGSKKLWQDEQRFTLHEALQELRHGSYTTETFAGIVRDLRTAVPGDDYVRELRLSCATDLKINVAPRHELLMLAKFVNSTDFLYTPVAPEIVGGAWGSMDPADWQVYNRNAVALGNLRRTTGMARPTGVSPQTLQELQIYAQTHGGLPPDVLALANTGAGE